MPLRQALRTILIASPWALLFGTCMHELAHAVVALFFGGTITEFRPYPSVVDGHFVFGYVAGENGAAPQWLCLLAPQIVDTVLVAGGLVWLNRHARPHLVTLVLLVVTPVVDLSTALSGLVCASVHSDWYRVLEGYEGAAITVTVTLVYSSAVFAWPAVRRTLCAIRGHYYALLVLAIVMVPWGRRLFP